MDFFIAEWKSPCLIIYLAANPQKVLKPVVVCDRRLTEKEMQKIVN